MTAPGLRRTHAADRMAALAAVTAAAKDLRRRIQAPPCAVGSPHNDIFDEIPYAAPEIPHVTQHVASIGEAQAAQMSEWLNLGAASDREHL